MMSLFMIIIMININIMIMIIIIINNNNININCSWVRPTPSYSHKHISSHHACISFNVGSSATSTPVLCGWISSHFPKLQIPENVSTSLLDDFPNPFLRGDITLQFTHMYVNILCTARNCEIMTFSCCHFSSNDQVRNCFGRSLCKESSPEGGQMRLSFEAVDDWYKLSEFHHSQTANSI